MTSFLNSKAFLHFLFALAILPFQQSFPEFVKLAFIPYVYFLVNEKNPIYIPALIALVTPGTTIAYGVLLSTLILSLINYKLFLSYNLKYLFILTVLPIPIFLNLVYERVFINGDSFLKSLLNLDYFLSLYPFFYGILCVKKLDDKSIKGIYISLFLLPLFGALSFVDFGVRVLWLSYPVFFIGLLISLYLKYIKVTLSNYLILFSFLFLLINDLPKFTLVFSGIVGLLIMFFKIKKNQIWLSFFTTWIFLFLCIAIFYFVISDSGLINPIVKNLNIENTEINYYESWSSFKNMLYFKTFGDRVPIWVGGWDAISKQKEFLFLPPLAPFKYSILTFSGYDIEVNELPVHNLLLELMRNYGLFFGAYIFLVFSFFLILGPGKFIRKTNSPNILLFILAAGSIGSALMGALVGQYPLLLTFSISLITLFGIFHGLIQTELTKNK